MAKKDKNVISITAGKAIKQPRKVLAKGINQPTERDFIILEAKIKDDFCHFTYEIISGVGKGFVHGVKGDGIILDDMRKAFAQFNVHLAYMDDVFKHSDIEILDIDQHHGHELTGLYHVTGFKIKGDGTFDSIVLSGNKYVSGGGRIEFDTPKAALDNLSSYKWWPELEAVLIARSTMSLALYYQIVGRAMRPHKAKEEAWIVDLGGNIDLFGKIESLRIVVDEKGKYSIWNNVRQLTNVTFKKAA